MTFREKLADWISGGALTRERQSTLKNAMFVAEILMRNASALYKIAAMETPKANATVRRMARIAREALE